MCDVIFFGPLLFYIFWEWGLDFQGLGDWGAAGSTMNRKQRDRGHRGPFTFYPRMISQLSFLILNVFTFYNYNTHFLHLLHYEC